MQILLRTCQRLQRTSELINVSANFIAHLGLWILRYLGTSKKPAAMVIAGDVCDPIFPEF